MLMIAGHGLPLPSYQLASHPMIHYSCMLLDILKQYAVTPSQCRSLERLMMMMMMMINM